MAVLKLLILRVRLTLLVQGGTHSLFRGPETDREGSVTIGLK